MIRRLSTSSKIFAACNHTFLILLSLLCILPVVHVWALSFSNSSAASAGLVQIWPVDFTLNSYRYILHNSAFFSSFYITLERAALGTIISMALSILTAYPLSKEVRSFRFRTIYAWYYVFTILFNGGLIPWYLSVQYTGLIDSLWALIVPGAIQVFNIVLLINFFRDLPKELEESAFIDGAGHWRILRSIFVPLALPAMATLILLTLVWHWNSWFDGLLLMNSQKHYPLSTYLQTIVIQGDLSHLSTDNARLMSSISDRTIKSAQIFLGALPIILIYPFLQKYFVKGLVMGSVKE